MDAKGFREDLEGETRRQNVAMVVRTLGSAQGRPISESWSHKFVLIARDVTFCFNYAALSGR